MAPRSDRRTSDANRSDPSNAEPGPAERYRRFRERTAQTGPQLAAFRESLEIELDDFQVDSCAALERGQSVLVAAPTGAGKTIVGEFAVHLAIASGRKAFYTTPIKALSNQKYADLVRRYGTDSVGLLTGDTTINGEAPVVVMTTEVLRNMLYADSPTLAGLGFVVMDEVHYLADRFRGAVWEEVIIHLASDVQLVSLSATVSNAEEFGDWLEMVRGDTAVVVSEHRPVPLSQHVVVAGRGTNPGGILDLYAHMVDPTSPGTNPPINPDLLAVMRQSEGFRGSGSSGGGWGGGRGRGRRGGRGGPSHPSAPSQHSGRRGPPRFAVVDGLDRAGLLPAIFFIFSRAGCEGAVAQCLGAGLRLTSPAQEAQIREIVEARCAAIPSEDLAILGYWGWLDALSRGVAAHHAGMLPLFKETVEELFSAGLVKVVFATETLALGINMPARSVVLEKLVKWDGSSHVDLTPGEYTQLTGRAGRRGIDVEGHAVVVDHPGLDPVALAGLASKRLYPLRSSFSPTYNMAVNLVSQVGRERAREILETSFAQFQADRGVVGLAKQAAANSEALDGYARAQQCDKGDFTEYMRLRRAITAREGALAKRASGERRSAIVASLTGLQRGDIIEIPSGRRAGYAIIIDPGQDAGFDGPRPTVLSSERQVQKLTLADVPHGVETVGAIRIPKAFNARNPAARRELSVQLRAALNAPGGPGRTGGGASSGTAPGRGVRRGAGEDAELGRLQSALRAHACHSCPDREDHVRWATRWTKLDAEHRALLRRIEGRTGSIAKVFDRICEVLSTLGYLERQDGELVVTAPGAALRRLYAESDLLLAECLRLKVWEGLDAAGLAAAVSTLVYSARRDDSDGDPHIPGGPGGVLARALDETIRVWSKLDDLEAAHRLEATGALDLGLVEAVHRWASGRGLDVVLKGTDFAAGDFVRWCKQIIDVLGQLTKAAPDQHMRATADQAIEALRRGVVAYSSV
ncbi:ATP-dependent RNA helicase HelY [Sanguibacter gelidistatuariae]|uniref:ATP-dependent RNA helicase HelY n=1 Tax=Sanguibacter gelidistatuariae TaxID=1814289 RepID=A0A1G6JEW6_9MICO|nr:DEAD/DEAH box helicase [Sanguibacter gelidistatuariae]SDC17197.1 ATP-dependent RNA helicase HelY [Sanguibacter gelidistatuariae]